MRSTNVGCDLSQVLRCHLVVEQGHVATVLFGQRVLPRTAKLIVDKDKYLDLHWPEGSRTPTLPSSAS